MTILIQILGIAVGFGFLIFIHELGHFLVAKICKVKILTFAFGFGPDIIKHTYKGTKYCIKAIPFGGFVSMAGDDPDKATGADGEYLSLKWYKKAWIALAGPLSNYILAAFILAFVFNIWGSIRSSSVGSVVENSPAKQAGIMPGDKIKSIDGIEIDTWDELTSNLKDKTGKQTVLVVERGTHSFDLNMTVTKNPVTNFSVIGIEPSTVKVKLGFVKSILRGVKYPIRMTVENVEHLANVIVSFKKPAISGPIGIMRAMADATKTGMYNYLSLLAFISVALGLFNLLPIPMVDGGMIVLFFIEGIIRKRISAKVVQVYNTIGLVFIGGIFIFATYSDLLHLGIGKLFGK
ncbi:RIP metalloprotease RseP [Endomicrobiia bacterium]|nr:RIP metalloprotease RseP [Endomicrobiia bacterium]